MLLACVHDRRVGHQRRQWRQVIIWSNEAATFDGAIFAEDGVQAGNGGFVETSEHALTFNGSVDTSTPNGVLGTLLLDPPTRRYP